MKTSLKLSPVKNEDVKCCSLQINIFCKLRKDSFFVGEKIPKDPSTLCDKILEWTDNFPGFSAAERTLHLASCSVAFHRWGWHERSLAWSQEVSADLLTQHLPVSYPLTARNVTTKTGTFVGFSLLVFCWFVCYCGLLLFLLNGSLRCSFPQGYPTGRQALVRQHGEKVGREIKCSYSL